MELKVWVDGVQRIVCGVTEATTCQEVVIALAQAIGESQVVVESLGEHWDRIHYKDFFFYVDSTNVKGAVTSHLCDSTQSHQPRISHTDQKF